MTVALRLTAVLALVLSACSNPPRRDGGVDGASDAASDAGPSACVSTAECPAGQVCDRVGRACVECVTADDCPAGRACTRHACVATTPCTSSRMCPGQVCDPVRGYCVDCVTAADCTGAGEVCQRNACQPPPPACRSSRECSAMGLVCNVGLGVCVECVAAADCAANEYCADDGLCLRRVCAPGQGECTDATTGRRCDERGAAWVPTRCRPTESCREGACVARTCAPGEAACNAMGQRVVCASDGLGTLPMPCPAMQSCRTGNCVAWACTPSMSDCASPSTRRTCSADGLIASTEPCPAGQGCRAGACVPWTCTPGAAECVGTTMRRVCSADGAGYVTSPCAERQTCEGATCRDWACTPGSVTCDDSATASVCSDDGLRRTPRACAAGQSCAPPGGCTGWICTPGSASCASTGERSVCNPDGLGRTTAPCVAPPRATAVSCVAGSCVPTCEPGYVASGTTCRAAADACPGRDVVPDGPPVIIPATDLASAPDYGTSCGSRGTTGGWVDWVAHFTLAAPRDAVVTMTGGTSSTRMQLQSTCSAGGTPVGPCLAGSAITRRYRALPAGDYFVVGENNGAAFGPISVQVTTTAPGTRLPGDACPGVDAMPDGATIAVDPTPFDTSSDVGTECGSRGPATAWVDWIYRFTLATDRDATVNLMGLPPGSRVQVQQTCAPGATLIGACRSESGSATRLLRGLTPGDYFVVVEVPEGTALGPVGIAVTTAPPTPVVNYAVSMSPPGVSWINVCGAAGSMRVLPNVDDSYAPVPPGFVPFPLRMYGVPITTALTISSNGWVSLRPGDSGALSGTVPDVAAPNLTLAPAWTDQLTGVEGVCFAVVGAAPDRAFVVQWANNREYGATGTMMRYEVIINEQTSASGNNVIDFVYDNFTGLTRTYSAGIENDDGTLAALVPMPLTAPRVVRFTPLR